MPEKREVQMPNIEKLSISIKKGLARISFEAAASPELLKLIHLQGGGSPIDVVFSSPQAEFDLIITVVDRNGEIKN